MAFWLIKRGPRPSYHKAPFHSVILCDKKRIARWEVGDTGKGSWLWSCGAKGEGWLLERWNGLDIDYGPVVHSIPLPDGYTASFYRDYTTKDPKQCIKHLFDGAVWWSDKPLPSWLANLGVVYPPDTFTRQVILDEVADDGLQGFPRCEPTFWPTATEEDRVS